MISWERVVETRNAHRKAWTAIREARRAGGGIPAEVSDAFFKATDETSELFRELAAWFDMPQFPGEE